MSTKKTLAAIHEEEIPETLHAYSSGDGSISFTWAKNENSTGRVVTREDVEQYLTSPAAEVFRKKNYRILQIGPWEDSQAPAQFKLIAPIRRINKTTLDIDGVEYFIINVVRGSGNRIMHACLDVEFKVEELGRMKLRHDSTRAAIAHFLENELIIPPLP